MFDPVTRLEMEWRSNRLTNPGHREQWDLRPSWHGLIYGNGKRGSGTESVVNPEAVHLWPVTFDAATGKIRRPSKDSKHHDAVVTVPKADAPKRRRRTSSRA